MSRLCKKNGYASEFLDIGKSHPTVIFAGATISKCEIPVLARGVPLFMIEKAEEVGAPFRLSANFFNSQGKISLQIIQNEWRAYEKNWDVEVTGGRIIIRDEPRHISLKLAVAPPNGIAIEQLDMNVGGLHFLGNIQELKFGSPI